MTKNEEIKDKRPESISLDEIQSIRASMTLQEAEEEAWLQNTLLRCPFCGGRAEAVILRNPEAYYHGSVISVKCNMCGKTVYFRGYHTLDDARDLWNQRVLIKTPARQTADSGDSKAAVHYQLLSQQPIEIMQTLFTADEFRGFLWGNVIKYSLRYGHKDERRKEAEKIAQYAQWLAMAERGERIEP